MPIFPLVFLAAAQAAAPAAAAQPVQVFIAPSGEPFRAALGQPYPVAQWFAQADTNHDGKITSTEFLVDFMRFYDSLDTNHDGRLDAGEIAHYESDIAPEAARGGPDGAHGEGRGDGRGGPERRDGGRRGGFGGGGEGMPGGGGFSSRHFQDMGEGDSGESQSEYGPDVGSVRTVDTNRPRAMGAARFDLLGIPEPVSAMAHDLDGVVYRRDALNASTQRFNALDTKGLGYLTLDDLPETIAQRHKGRWKG